MEIKGYKGRQTSYTGREWEDFKGIIDTNDYDILPIEEEIISDILGKYFYQSSWYVIDIFPYPIPDHTLHYGEVEQYFLSNIYNNFTSKCLLAILKLSCYIPYTHIIIDYYQEDNNNHVQEVLKVFSRFNVKNIEELIKNIFLKNGRIHFYFEKVSTIITLYCDDLVASIYYLEYNEDFIKKLETFILSEGLFLRACTSNHSKEDFHHERKKHP